VITHTVYVSYVLRNSSTKKISFSLKIYIHFEPYPVFVVI
jgi:hypothetical protein